MAIDFLTIANSGDLTKRELTSVASGSVNARWYGAIGNGAADDRVALQAAIDAGSGGTVFVPAGVYSVSRVNPGTTDYCLAINNPTHLVLMKGAEIKLADNDLTADTDFVDVIEIFSSNVTISGEGTINGNRANQVDLLASINSRTCIIMRTATDNTRIEGITITGSAGNGMFLGGSSETVGRATNIIVTKTNVVDCREGYLFHWSDNTRVINNYCRNFNDILSQDNFETSYCNDTVFMGNYAEGELGARGAGFDIFEQGGRCVCTGNICFMTGEGVSIGSNTGGATPGAEALVANNIIISPQSLSGIRVYITIGSDRVIIDNNIIFNVVTISQHAIEARAGSHIQITNNIVDGTAVGGGGNGVFILAGVDDTIVRGNKIANTAFHGIRCDADDCIVDDNKLINIGGVDGIQLNGSNGKIDGNKLDGEQITDNGTSNLVINNRCLALIATGATTPFHHNNLINNIWTV